MRSYSHSLKDVHFVVLSALFLWIVSGCASNQLQPSSDYAEDSTKQRGVHFFGEPDSLSLKLLKERNVKWITLVNWAYQDEVDSPIVNHPRSDSTEIARRNSYYINNVKAYHDAGFKVFLKPHIWIRNNDDGKWRSDVFPKDEGGWNSWKNSYRDFILLYAEVAEMSNIDMFCIGAELSLLTKHKEEFWIELIKDVRQVYSGKLTYAANWYDEYENIGFWDALDYIGIQAYFPLTKKESPSVDELNRGWAKYIPDMIKVSEAHNKKILFTELGYKSTIDSAMEPWKWIEDYEDRSSMVSIETQAHCYTSFFETIWSQPWFAGVHVWKYKPHYFGRDDMRSNSDFTPQGKLAEEILVKYFEADK